MMLKARLVGGMSSFVAFTEHGRIGYSSGVHVIALVDRWLNNRILFSWWDSLVFAG
jgi:hypothetical protein